VKADYGLTHEKSVKTISAPFLPYLPVHPENKLPIGVVGCGGISEWHCAAYRRLGALAYVWSPIHRGRDFQTGGFGEIALTVIEGKENLRAAFQGESNMEQVNDALPML
jgi:hypothetical protein